MGAGKNRKKKDRPSIKPPENTSDVQNTNNSSVGGAQDLCVATFDIKVNQTTLTLIGASAQLSKTDSYYAIIVQDEKVGLLSKNQSLMVEQCGEMGIRYTGSIINKKGGIYARFSRIA